MKARHASPDGHPRPVFAFGGRQAGDLMVRFSGDTNQAVQFARGVPDFVLKRGCADVVRLVAANQRMIGSVWSEAIAGGSMIMSCY